MKTKYTNLAIFTFLFSLSVTENLQNHFSQLFNFSFFGKILPLKKKNPGKNGRCVQKMINYNKSHSSIYLLNKWCVTLWPRHLH